MATFTSFPMKRPRGIAILAGVLAAGSVVFLLGASALLLADQFRIYRGAIALAGVSHDAQIGTGLLALAGSAVQFALAAGLFRLRRWAWGLSVLVMGANVGFDAVEIYNGALLSPDQVAMATASALILLYLFAPDVIRAFFRKSPSAAAAMAS